MGKQSHAIHTARHYHVLWGSGLELGHEEVGFEKVGGEGIPGRGDSMNTGWETRLWSLALHSSLPLRSGPSTSTQGSQVTWSFSLTCITAPEPDKLGPSPNFNAYCVSSGLQLLICKMEMMKTLTLHIAVGIN